MLALTASVPAPREILVAGRLAAVPGLLDGARASAWRGVAPVRAALGGQERGARRRAAGRRPRGRALRAARRPPAPARGARRRARPPADVRRGADRARLARRRRSGGRATCCRSDESRHGVAASASSGAGRRAARRARRSRIVMAVADRLDALLRGGTNAVSARPRGARGRRRSSPRTQSSADREARPVRPRSTTDASSLRFISSKISLDIAPSTIASARSTSNSSAQPSGHPRADVPMPRWSWRATGTAVERADDLGSPRTRSARRPLAGAAAMSASCALRRAVVDALRGDADQPTRAARATPRAAPGASRSPASARRTRGAGPRRSGTRAAIVTSTRGASPALAHVLDDAPRRAARRACPRASSDDLAHHLEPRRSSKRWRVPTAKLPSAGSTAARHPGGERLRASARSTPRRTTAPRRP